jgi:hypothetical protein
MLGKGGGSVTTLLPNTFQCPNDVVDQVLSLLTGDELKVWLFSIRHILGWRDRIATRRANISVRSISKGFKTKAGAVYAGTGLHVQTIMKCLDNLQQAKLLVKVGTHGTKGDLWELPETIEPDGIAWLQARQATKKQKRKSQHSKREEGGSVLRHRTLKASDEGPSVLRHRTPSVLRHRTPSVLRHRTIQTHSNPTQTHEGADAPASGESTGENDVNSEHPISGQTGDKPKDYLDHAFQRVTGIPESVRRLRNGRGSEAAKLMAEQFYYLTGLQVMPRKVGTWLSGAQELHDACKGDFKYVRQAYDQLTRAKTLVVDPYSLVNTTNALYSAAQPKPVRMGQQAQPALMPVFN